MRKTQFFPGQYYHIFNHGIEERKVFLSSNDYRRFLISLGIFNNLKSSPHNLGRFINNPDELLTKYEADGRNQLVDIITFTLLPTHYHFFVQEKEERGISRFMHRLAKGYSRYFNLKYERIGTLWQGSFKANLIDKEAYFIHIMSYVHLNILDLYYPEWRGGKIENWKEAENKMRSYPWSSYGYYRRGTSKLPYMKLILTKPDWFDEYFPSAEDFEKNLELWSSRNLNILGVTE